MRLWLDFSIKLGARENTLIGYAHDVIQILRDAGIERDRSPHSPAFRHTDVVWRRASRMEDYGTEWVPHRVIRRSPQTVLVEAHPAISAGRTNEDSPGRSSRAYWLNRWDLERIGVARVRSRAVSFYTRPSASDEAVRTIESLIRLGIWFPFTEKDLRQAYIRRASQHHPDVGGSDEKFIQLQDDHERAMVALNLPVNDPDI
jgi:hypothetical protein